MRVSSRHALCLLAGIAAAVAVPVNRLSVSAGTQAAGRGHAVCAAPAPGFARCFALAASAHRDGSTPPGYGAPDLQSAYALPVTQGRGQTIAIVDATDDPTAAADLAVYRKQYGLPPCTTSNGCFRKLNQQGAPGPYPQSDPGWDVEISLDLDMVSAACPLCHIVLLEGNTPSVADLGTTEDSAAALHVAAISNSYGLQEFNGMQQFFKHYQHPGTAIVVASGDFGFGPANFPAVMRNVTAVGGTTLVRSSARRGWSETAWQGASSGCSAYVQKPAWQHDDHCFMRTVADVSADADMSPGLAVYDTSIPPGFDNLQPGWITVGGTSASAPFIAGVIGLAGNGSTYTPAYAYHHAASFNDVIGGSNGYCGGDYLCNGVRGYDAPTGVGSPDGASGL